MKIYVVKVNSISDTEFDYMLRTLPIERQNRILRQRIKQNTDNMLISSILVRYAIKKEFDIPISNQVYDVEEYGKPYLKNNANIHFNVSHSGNIVVCAVADVSVGIDIQKVSEFNLGVAKRVCNEQELAQIFASTDKASEFIKLWTQKEAYVKMLGCGIGQIDLKSIPTRNIKTIIFEDCYISYCHNRV